MALVAGGVHKFDEEAVEREEFNLEQQLQEFENEPSIQHDELPETDEEEEEKNREAPERMRTHIRRGDGYLYRDQTFFNGVAFKDSVLDYALRTCRNIKQYMYDKEKIGFECSGRSENDEACGWEIYASILPKDKIWRVRLYVDSHTCEVSGECEMVKVPVIARLFVNKIREDPTYYLPQKIEELVMENWSISVSRPQCQFARKTALKWIKSEYEEQFARLRDYAAELELSNPGSSVELETIQNAEGQDVFNRFYVCFGVLMKTWKDSCRPLIGLDGCSLKHCMKGQLLVALGRDANNAIYPIAWGVVEVENNDDVMATNPRSWCRAFFKVGNYCEDVENNSTESFNSSINKAREKPFIPMLQTIARLAMTRIAIRSILSHDHQGKCTPYVQKVLAKALVDKPSKDGARKCFVTRSVRGDFDARLNDQTHRVNLDKRTCSCRKFDITGIPCKHAYGVILKLKLDPSDYVCDWFRTAMWRKNYTDGLVPIRGSKFWPKTNTPDVHAPSVKEKQGEETEEETGEERGKERGKKKLTKADKTRKRGVNESPTKKQPKQKKRIMHCGVCGTANHNSRWHSKHDSVPVSTSQTEGESSQGTLTQA